MGWFSKKQEKNKQMDCGKIDNLNDLFEHLIRREHWKEINPDIIKQIFKNSQSNILIQPMDSVEILKLFIFISEVYNLVENSYIKIAKDTTANLGDILGSFSSTLYFLGSKLGKACHFAKMQDELEGYGMCADAAFMSSILCNQFNLSSYYGMVVLQCSFKNKDVGLEFCAKYRQAEDMLLNTPDNELTPLQLTAKDNLNHPEEIHRDLKKLEKLDPHLFPGGVPSDLVQFEKGYRLRDHIDELEKKLLQL